MSLVLLLVFLFFFFVSIVVCASMRRGEVVSLGWSTIDPLSCLIPEVDDGRSSTTSILGETFH